MHQQTIYWHNPGCLEKAAKVKLATGVKKYKEENNLDISLKYYGLVEDKMIFDQIWEEAAIGKLHADAVVSLDMQAFHREDLLPRWQDEWMNLNGVFPIKEKYRGLAHPAGIFQPALIIPVLIIRNKNIVKANEAPTTWKDLTAKKWLKSVAVFNLQLPAGKSLLKGLWYLLGKEEALRFLAACTQLQAPAVVLDAVAKGEFPLGIVPLLFSARLAHAEEVENIYPREGGLGIVSYVAVKKRCVEAATFIKETLYSRDMQGFYGQRGLALAVHPDVSCLNEKDEPPVLIPPWDWLKENNMQDVEPALQSVF